MLNLAGMKPELATYICDIELRAAGIGRDPIDPMKHPEVRSGVGGSLAGWTFHRQWYYWAAHGPVLPLPVALTLWEEHGQYVRAGGDCACRKPVEGTGGYPSAGSYHIDNMDGLIAFAAVLRAAEGREG